MVRKTARFSESLSPSEELAERIIHERRLGGGCLVIEIVGSNDHLLQTYQRAGVPVLEIAPVREFVFAADDQRNAPTITKRFELSLADELAFNGQQADVLHAQIVFAPAADFNDFVRGIHRLLKPHGIGVIEVLNSQEFSFTWLDRLLQRNGLKTVHVERVPNHSGSARLFVSRDDSYEQTMSNITALLAEESLFT